MAACSSVVSGVGNGTTGRTGSGLGSDDEGLRLIGGSGCLGLLDLPVPAEWVHGFIRFRPSFSFGNSVVWAPLSINGATFGTGLNVNGTMEREEPSPGPPPPPMSTLPRVEVVMIIGGASVVITTGRSRGGGDGRVKLFLGWGFIGITHFVLNMKLGG